jgi:hypothetical protein
MKRYALLTIREKKPVQHYYAQLDDIQAMIEITRTDYDLKQSDVLHELDLVECHKLPITAQYII